MFTTNLRIVEKNKVMRICVCTEQFVNRFIFALNLGRIVSADTMILLTPLLRHVFTIFITFCAISFSELCDFVISFVPTCMIIVSGCASSNTSFT